MKRDTVFGHQGSEILRRVSRQSRATKMRILRQKIRRTRVEVSEVAPTTARNANLLANRFCMVNQRNLPPTLPRPRSAKQPRSARADNDYVKVWCRRHGVNVTTGRRANAPMQQSW